MFKWLHLSSLWVYRMVTWTILICAFVSALVVGGVSYWLLPNIESYREAIARDISAAARQRITIGKLAGRWSGFNLQLTLGDVAVFDQRGAAGAQARARRQHPVVVVADTLGAAL